MSEWIDVAPESEFGEGQARLVLVNDMDVAVFNLDGDYYAIEDRCTHDGSPLLGSDLPAEELIDADQVICPRHGARFCIRTGAALTPPAYEDIPSFPVRVNQGNVQVQVA